MVFIIDDECTFNSNDGYKKIYIDEDRVRMGNK